MTLAVQFSRRIAVAFSGWAAAFSLIVGAAPAQPGPVAASEASALRLDGRLQQGAQLLVQWRAILQLRETEGDGEERQDLGHINGPASPQ